jgi:hypothetical protein
MNIYLIEPLLALSIYLDKEPILLQGDQGH